MLLRKHLSNTSPSATYISSSAHAHRAPLACAPRPAEVLTIGRPVASAPKLQIYLSVAFLPPTSRVASRELFCRRAPGGAPSNDSRRGSYICRERGRHYLFRGVESPKLPGNRIEGSPRRRPRLRSPCVHERRALSHRAGAASDSTRLERKLFPYLFSLAPCAQPPSTFFAYRRFCWTLGPRFEAAGQVRPRPVDPEFLG